MRPVVRLKPAKQAPKPSGWAPYAQMVPSLVQSLVLLVVGFALTGQVEQALADRQATVSGQEAMNDLLGKIASAEQDEALQLKHVRRLSMYGVDAIGPLITLGLGQEVPISLPAQGLTFIAVRHPNAVCDALGNVDAFAHQFRDDASAQLRYLQDLAKALNCQRWRPSWWSH